MQYGGWAQRGPAAFPARQTARSPGGQVVEHSPQVPGPDTLQLSAAGPGGVSPGSAVLSLGFSSVASAGGILRGPV